MSDKFGYTAGTIDRPGHFFVAGVEIALEDRDVPHAILFEYTDGEWTAWSVDFRLAGIACQPGPAFELFAVGDRGEAEVTAPEEAWDEQVDTTSDGPSDLRPLQSVQIIGQHLYVAGMRRQVYRRTLGVRGAWERFDEGCLVGADRAEISGFTSVHGLDERVIYAVGYGGQIWSCTAGAWAQLDSPTDARLEVVRMLGSGDVLAGGTHGTLLRGRQGRFRIVDHGATVGTFVSIVEAMETTWLCTEQGELFTIAGDALTPVRPPAMAEEGGGRLASDGQMLLYVGNQVAALRDNKTWRDVTPPDE